MIEWCHVENCDSKTAKNYASNTCRRATLVFEVLVPSKESRLETVKINKYSGRGQSRGFNSERTQSRYTRTKRRRGDIDKENL